MGIKTLVERGLKLDDAVFGPPKRYRTPAERYAFAGWIVGSMTGAILVPVLVHGSAATWTKLGVLTISLVPWLIVLHRQRRAAALQRSPDHQ